MSLHFIRPEWLIALLPLGVVLWLLLRHHGAQSAWDRYIAPHLAAVMVGHTQQHRRPQLKWLAFSWTIAVLALAGPAVSKQNLPVFATEQGRVIIMDMSLSMYATDQAPNRLSQAKFKAIDLINTLKEGETGLIAFAGDAFTISPLTRDSATLLNLLPTLSPDIMPVKGSNLSLALTQAKQLLTQGGHLQGDIIVLTDGINARQFDAAKESLEGSHYRVSVLAFGSQQGAPIRLPDGQLLRDSSNQVVVATTDFGLLQKLSRAQHGILAIASADNHDIEQITAWLNEDADKQAGAKATDINGEVWQDLGPYLAMLLLLPALLSFRYGLVSSFATILGLGLGLSLGLSVPKAHASEPMAAVAQTASASDSHSAWDNLWQTQNQQAQDAYQNGNYQGAAEQFTDPSWRASAQYKAGDYEAALKGFEQDDSAKGLYNQGNSLMQLGNLTEAIKRYQQALEKSPSMDAAKANLELAKQLEEQQKASQGDGQSSNDSSDNQSDNQSKDSSQQDKSKQGDKSQDNQSQGSQSQGSQSQGSQSQDSQSQQNDADSTKDQETGADSANNEDSANDEAQNDSSAPESDPGTDTENAGAKQNDTPNEATPQTNDAKMQADASEIKSADPAEKSNSDNKAQLSAASPNDGENPDDKTPNGQAQVAASELNPDALPADMERALRALADDPQVLLRNKMQLEYQKRRQQGQLPKDNEQW